MLDPENKLEGVIRSKGFMWYVRTFWQRRRADASSTHHHCDPEQTHRVATRPEWLGEWHGAGDVYRFESNEKWYADEPKEDWDMKEESIMKDWEEPWGDRRQELVFIGAYLHSE